MKIRNTQKSLWGVTRSRVKELLQEGLSSKQISGRLGKSLSYTKLIIKGLSNQEWYARNRERQKLSSKRYRENQPKKILSLQEREEKRRWHREYYARSKNLVGRLNKSLRERYRKEALLAYGERCVCCGENEEKFLTLDHTKSDGNKHLNKNGIRLKGYSLYRWLKLEGYPKDGRFQILCWNCNCAKGAYGICPHEEKQT